MKKAAFDLVVIGAGTGAREGAKKAKNEFGARVALVENTRWGGSCPNVACKPTKAYVVVAELVHDIHSLASTLGIEVGPARADLGRIKARKDELIGTQAAWRKRVEDAYDATHQGTATFADSGTVRVGDSELSAERFLIATGSRTAEPPIEGLGEVGWIDHVGALELSELPESLLVVGGGAVGLEFAQIFSRFGSKVTVVDAEAGISPGSDRAAAAELAVALEAEGITIVTGAFVKRAERRGGGVAATIVPRGGGPGSEIEAAQILLAAGRLPNVEELSLERAGVEHTKLGITVDLHMRTSAERIWASGDVTGLAQFTPIAQYQARIAVENMFTGNGRVAQYSGLPTAIFTDPELAQVGLTEQEALEAGHDVGTAVHLLRNVQRAAYTDTKHGLFKIVFDRASRGVLGLHVVARGASDVVQGYAVALHMGATVDDLANAHHAFPTIGEGVKAAAEQAAASVDASAQDDVGVMGSPRKSGA